VAAIAGLLRQIKQKFSDYRIVLSVVTMTGYSLAVSQLKEADTVLFAPLDFSFVVEKYIRLISPRIYISVETEIWPNLFRALEKNAAPIVLVNGRISDKSFPRYFLLRFLFKKILRGV
ncbi:MAG TPA: glycosyltransferase N-terminal domain-containing protein, partial [Candidatus Omnitrophota bacterium]|nr:glycosyltransferase N-terminal domain-containing protein [Candidatus Omnitrophota bacterium]